MSIVDGTGLVTWEGGLFEPNSDLLRRVKWAFGKIREDGGTIVLDEAGRPFGVPGDAKVSNAWETASGISTVWFQWGRYLRGETPSAADPRSGNVLASEHTRGIAIDCDAKDVYTATLRAKYFAQVGMKQTIPSESWHWAIRSNPTVDIASTVSSIIAPSAPTQKELDMKSTYLIRGAVGPSMSSLNGLIAVIGPNLFTALGSEDDWKGIIRDTRENPADVLDGYDPVGGGLGRSELVRLSVVFGIPAGYFGPGGRWYGPGHPDNRGAKL